MTTAKSDDVRTRIIAAASRLLAKGDRDALTTRAVADAACVQAPTIYRLFGDKRGLLDAVVAYGLASYIAAKAANAAKLSKSSYASVDPIDDLRRGWDEHIEFGLANPAIYALMADPSLHLESARQGTEYLAQRIHRIALAGRLRVSEESAIALVHAAGLGTVLALLERPPIERDLGLSAIAREAVIHAITTTPSAVTARIDKDAPAPEDRAFTAAIALRANISELSQLSKRERDLLDEWLARITSPRKP